MVLTRKYSGIFICLWMCYNKLIMKYGLFAIILVISFAVVAVFGFWLMTHEQMMGHGNCVANTVQGSMCAQTNPFAFAGFHISAFNNFFSVIFQNFIVFILSTLALLILCLLNSPPLFFERTVPNLEASDRLTPKRRIMLTFWFSLHETSPTLI
jgi:hypothetical protein